MPELLIVSPMFLAILVGLAWLVRDVWEDWHA